MEQELNDFLTKESRCTLQFLERECPEINHFSVEDNHFIHRLITSKKIPHKIIEKNYRDSINKNIRELENLIPCNNTKMTKKAVLSRALEYIRELEQENETQRKLNKERGMRRRRRRGEKMLHKMVQRKYRTSINHKITELKDVIQCKDPNITKRDVLIKAIERIKELQQKKLNRMHHDVSDLPSQSSSARTNPQAPVQPPVQTPTTSSKQSSTVSVPVFMVQPIQSQPQQTALSTIQLSTLLSRLPREI